jgi:SAM-dependent methyltransferase
LPGSPRGRGDPSRNPERRFQIALQLPRHRLPRRQFDEGRAAGQVRHYHGIDLSQPALELAAANLAGLPFEIDLDHRDFVEAMMRRPEHADAAWCSLSIHHLSTQDKLSLMKAIRGAIGTGGIFLLYEPTRRAGEDRSAWLDRFVRTNKPLWRVLTPPEWDQIWHHVATCDFPETAAVWCELGREAGFREARQVFVDPTDFFQLFRFEA